MNSISDFVLKNANIKNAPGPIFQKQSHAPKSVLVD